MYTKSNARLGALAVAAICFFSFGAAAQSTHEAINVTIRSEQTPEDRVADRLKEHESSSVAEEEHTAQAANQLTAEDAKAMLARTRIIYISSNTVYFKPVQLQNALRKRPEFEMLKLAVIDSSDKQNSAHVNVEIDRPFFTYHFTYKITDRGTGLVLGAGKVTAFDGNAAAPKLAEKIVEEITKAQLQMKGSN